MQTIKLDHNDIRSLKALCDCAEQDGVRPSLADVVFAEHEGRTVAVATDSFVLVCLPLSDEPPEREIRVRADLLRAALSLLPTDPPTGEPDCECCGPDDGSWRRYAELRFYDDDRIIVDWVADNASVSLPPRLDALGKPDWRELLTRSAAAERAEPGVQINTERLAQVGRVVGGDDHHALLLRYAATKETTPIEITGVRHGSALSALVMPLHWDNPSGPFAIDYEDGGDQ